MPKINELSEKQDRELVGLLKDGSQEALGVLYARYRDRLMNFCKQYMRNKDDAEDIVHNIFLQLWEKRHLLNQELSFTGYIQTIAQNSVFYTFRQAEIHSGFVRSMLTHETGKTNETENTIIENNYAALLDKIIENLSPKQKEIFCLSRIDGFTYKEIAQSLHISVDTVQEHVSLALKKIKNHLMKHADIYFKSLIIITITFF